MSNDLNDLTAQLEEAAVQLRSTDLPKETAAELIDRCAKLLAEVGSELDRLSWAVPAQTGYDTLGQMSIEDPA